MGVVYEVQELIILLTTAGFVLIYYLKRILRKSVMKKNLRC